MVIDRLTGPEKEASLTSPSLGYDAGDVEPAAPGACRSANPPYVEGKRFWNRTMTAPQSQDEFVGLLLLEQPDDWWLPPGYTLTPTMSVPLSGSDPGAESGISTPSRAIVRRRAGSAQLRR